MIGIAGAGALGVNTGERMKRPYDPAKDLVPVTNVASGPQVLIVTPTFPPKTVREFIDLAKARPGQISYGSAGYGSQTHLAAENFLYAAKIDVVYVPYKGEAPAIVDTMAGQVPFSTPNLAAAINFIQQKKLRALGVTSKQRSPQVPDVPTAREAGYPNLTFEGVSGIFGWRDMPAEIKQRVLTDVSTIVRDPAFRERVVAVGTVPRPGTSEDFAAAMEDQRAKIVAIHEAMTKK